MRVAHLLPTLVLRALVLPALATLLAAAVACGEASQDTSESVASPAAETPLELLQRSNKVMATVGSYRAKTTTTQVTSMGQEVKLLFETDVGDDQWMHTRVSMEVPREGTIFEQVLTGEHAYSKVAGQGPAWVRTDLGALTESVDPLGLYNGLFPGGGFPWEAYSVESAGLRRIFGVKTEHLKVDLDFQRTWAALSQEQQQQLQQSLAPGPDAGEVLEQLQYESIDIWIDVSGYVRQFKMTISAGDASLEVDMVLTDLGEQVDIEEPTEYVDGS